MGKTLGRAIWNMVFAAFLLWLAAAGIGRLFFAERFRQDRKKRLGKQAELIKKLKKSGKFNNLPEDLKEIASLREENPEATLEQLGAMLKNPIGKSSVSHRLKKIEEYL